MSLCPCCYVGSVKRALLLIIHMCRHAQQIHILYFCFRRNASCCTPAALFSGANQFHCVFCIVFQLQICLLSWLCWLLSETLKLFSIKNWKLIKISEPLQGMLKR